MRLEDTTIWKQLSEEQRQAITKLQKETEFFAIKLGFKLIFMSFTAFLALVILDALYVNNSIGFLFWGSLLNGFFIGRSFFLSLKKQSDRVDEEIKKILKS